MMISKVSNWHSCSTLFKEKKNLTSRLTGLLKQIILLCVWRSKEIINVWYRFCLCCSKSSSVPVPAVVFCGGNIGKTNSCNCFFQISFHQRCIAVAMDIYFQILKDFQICRAQPNIPKVRAPEFFLIVRILTHASFTENKLMMNLQVEEDLYKF